MFSMTALLCNNRSLTMCHFPCAIRYMCATVYVFCFTWTYHNPVCLCLHCLFHVVSYWRINVLYAWQAYRYNQTRHTAWTCFRCFLWVSCKTVIQSSILAWCYKKIRLTSRTSEKKSKSVSHRAENDNLRRILQLLPTTTTPKPLNQFAP